MNRSLACGRIGTSMNNRPDAVILYDYEVQGLGSSGLGFFALSIDGLSWVVS